MSLAEQDPSLLQDFLTESGELVERLDADLVRLEHEASSRELLDGIFRAIHTIKGAASFLALNAVTRFTHTAEDALNKLRKGEASVNAEVIDALLKSVDVLRGMLSEVSEGKEASAGPEELLGRLKKIAEGASAPASPSAAPETPATTSEPAAAAGDRRPINLSSEKADLVSGLVAEIESSLDALDAGKIAETASGLLPTAEFFEFPLLIKIATRLGALALRSDSEVKAEIEQEAEQLRAFLAALKNGQELTASSVQPDSAPLPAPTESIVDEASAIEESASVPSAPATERGPAAPVPTTREPASKSTEPGETTVRVEVGRLESLLNLVGELVLTKNQVLGMARQLRRLSLPHEFMETVTSATGALDRLTSELQVGVMRTRLQPLNKLFGRYPRVIRDLARSTNKQIEIEIVGGDTEVDKSVLEQLADPMVHILRNSADHGIELPDVRIAAGKPASGRVRVEAGHQGGHVRVAIIDDGKGIDPDVIGPKAVEKGVITAEQLAQMTPGEVVSLVFAAGFSTVEKVSDLSGRGVGMDVVRTNIAKLGGFVSVTSVKGQGTTIEVLIPLTVAIMPAMMVEVGRHQYAMPLACITEIVRLEDSARHSVGGQPVVRIRETVMPLIDLGARLGELRTAESGRFAVVVAVGQQRAALTVDRLVGQQEVVIKPLNDSYTAGGPFSGATIREDGDVSLIIDATLLIRSAVTHDKAAV